MSSAGCVGCNDARPHSETTRDALIEFRRRARVESQIPDLQIKRLISDAGSEFMGVCETWINNQNIEHVKSVASKSKSNGMAEVSVRVWRRLLLGDYKAYKRRWEANNTPQAQRNYIWVDRCDEITRRMNQKRHHTLKACLPNVAGSAADRSTFFLLHGVVRDGPRAHSNLTSYRAERDNYRFFNKKKTDFESRRRTSGA